MDSEVSLSMNRAQNEIFSAQALKRLSEEEDLKKIFNFPPETTFFNGVIEHSYYAIFNCAKAYLLSKNIHLKSKQGQHQQVYFEFKKIVEKGLIETDLLKVYDDVKIKAEVLLEILKKEKEKRNTFTYETLPRVNKKPAEDSLDNAILFVSHIKAFLIE